MTRTDFSTKVLRSLGRLSLVEKRIRGRLCVLNYHRILFRADPLLSSDPDVETFRAQMEILAQCFNVIPLYDAVRRLENDSIEPRTICITFDDGYRSVHDLALPVLTELGLPATAFVTTGFMHDGNMWNDNIINAVRAMPQGKLDLRDVGLGIYEIREPDDRMMAISALIDASKYLPPADRAALDIKLVALGGEEMKQQLMMSREMLVNLSEAGIEIGGHTVNHPILKNLEDTLAREEIVNNKKELEAITGKPVRLFAYPNGKEGLDFEQRHVQMVIEAGYTAACTTALGHADSQADPYRIPRGLPWDKTPFRFGVRLMHWLTKNA